MFGSCGLACVNGFAVCLFGSLPGLASTRTYSIGFVRVAAPEFAICVSPPKQCVRRLRMVKGHLCACGCKNKMFSSAVTKRDCDPLYLMRAYLNTLRVLCAQQIGVFVVPCLAAGNCWHL